MILQQFKFKNFSTTDLTKGNQGNEKEQTIDTYNNLNACQGYYVEWKKSQSQNFYIIPFI